ncbi:MAG: DUF3850 domain-containing protein [Acetatifactor sp.]|nr:DUF3850 domain-containing protein [Acetatifactor sp.]
MQTVEYKILPKYYMEILLNNKNFELRKDEHNIQPGDVIRLIEHDGERYTGCWLCRTVRYVLRSVPEYGLMPGYCIIGF